MSTMSIRHFFKPKDGLPNPYVPLSQDLTTRVIQSVNTEVAKAQHEASTARKTPRGPYKKYTGKDRADIAKYAHQFGISAASKHFSKKLGVNISKTTVHSIRKSYISELSLNENESISVLPSKKRGRRLLLGEKLDKLVQIYLKKVRDGGGVVTGRIAIAAARGIILSNDKSQLVEYGGHISLNLRWAYSLLKRMSFVKRKSTTAKSKMNMKEFAELRKEFLSDVKATVDMEEIPVELVLNWDQTGIHIVPSSMWTMDKQGSKRIEIAGRDDKRLITAVFCGSAVGDFLPVQIIYKGKTKRCHPRFQFPPDWHITHSPRHWSTEETMLDYIKEIIVPYVQAQRELIKADKPALVVMDNFKGQVTDKVCELLEKNNIHTCLLPPNTTDRLQPMDLSVNKSAKSFLQAEFDDWYSGEINKQLQGRDWEKVMLDPVDLSMPLLRELGAKWLVEMAKYIAENPNITVNGFIKSGILNAMSSIDDDCPGQENEDLLDLEEMSSSDDDVHDNEEMDDCFEEEMDDNCFEEEILMSDEDDEYDTIVLL